MSSYVIIELDTTAPSNPTISLEDGATFATSQLIDATISVGDADTTNYQMKLWGDVDLTNDPDVQDTEADSSWSTFSNTKQVKLSSGDGQKTIYLRVRDDVYNESGLASDSITIDSSRPVVTTTNPDVNTISKVPGRNEASFSFTVDTPFEEYHVKVVSSTGASHDTGSQIGTANGSTGVQGSVGGYDTSTSPINVTVTGGDLQVASAGDGDKIIKVFVRDDAGNWSV